MSRIVLTLSGANDTIKLDVDHKGKTDDVYIYGRVIADFANILLDGVPQNLVDFACKVAESMEGAIEHMDEQERRAANQQTGVSLYIQKSIEDAKNIEAANEERNGETLQ